MPREAPEQLLDWNHADFHHRALQTIQHAGLKGHSVGKPGAQRVFGRLPPVFLNSLLHHRFSNDEFADQVQDIIDSLSINTQQCL